jgi:predicted N-acetyltransferase YhbS
MADMLTQDHAITGLAAADADTIEALLDAAFGADRRGRTAYRIREGARPLPGLSYATIGDDGALLGVLQSWPVALDSTTPLILVGPVAVAGTVQNLGIGRAMLGRLIVDAEAQDAAPLVLIGDPEYYNRFGFDAAATARWTVPGPVERRRLLARLPAGVQLPEEGLLGPRH